MTLFQLRQSFLLLLTALIWGCSFVAQAVSMDSVEPFTFTFARMVLSVAVLMPAVWLIRRRQPAKARERQSAAYRRQWILGSLCCGLCLFAGMMLQQFGLYFDTEVGKAGFITALYIVLVPILGCFLGKKQGILLWIAVAVAVAGLWLLCLPASGFTIELGDLLIFLCAFVFALHILVIAHFVSRVDGLELSLGQFVVGTVLGFAGMMLTEHPTLEGLQGALIPILWAGIMSNGVAYTLQIVGQRGMNETVASLIMSLESVFSVLSGWLILDEVLSARELFGCVLMTAAIVLAQLPPPGKKKETTEGL